MREKKQLRLFFQAKRRKISEERKEEAKKYAFETLSPLMDLFDHVLSFASHSDEINLWPLNEYLSKKRRLALPKMESSGLQYYLVENFEEQLKKQKWNILEPIPERCEALKFEKNICCLVPALAFDRYHHRLGYGHGHFDRFLKEHPTLITFGVGFEEQLSEEPFPIDPHDQTVTFLYLF